MPHLYKGRAVAIGVVQFGDLIAAQEAATASGKSTDAMWRMLIKAATYVDDGSLVFATVDDILKAPATEAGAIMEMSAEVSRVNLQTQADVNAPSL
jgi:hypothetical protein